MKAKSVIVTLLVAMCFGASGVQAQLATPNVITPNNNSKDQKVYLRALWSSITNADHYEFQLDTVNTFNSGFLFSTTTNTNEYYFEDLLFDTDYFFRVRAVNSGGTGNWSSIVKFTTLDLPDVLSFTNGSTVFVGSIVVAYFNGAKLHFQVDTSAQFNSPALLDYVSPHRDSTRHEYRDLFFAQKYYFRARALHDKDTTPWIATRSVTTLGGSAYYTPDGKQLIQDHTWTRGYYSGITYPGVSYQFQLDTTKSYNSPLLVDLYTDSLHFQDSSGRYRFGSTWHGRIKTFTPVDTSGWHEITFTIFSKPDILQPLSSKKDIQPFSIRPGQHSGVDYYLYRWDKNSSFNSGREVEDTLANLEPLNGKLVSAPFFGRNYIGLRAVHGSDTSEERTMFFDVDQTVTPSKPSNNTTLPGVQADFAWTGPANCLYLFETDTSADFGSQGLRTFVTLSKDSSVNELYYGRKHYWRVRALNSVDSGIWMTQRIFHTPAAPVLSWPDNLDTGFSVGLELYCDEISGSSYYEFELSESSDFSVSVRDTASADPDWGQAFIELKNLQAKHSTWYYWRARAIHARDTSAWSPSRSFKTGVALPTPDTVQLISPPDRSKDLARDVTMTWQNMDDVYYMFQISTDPAFGPGTDSVLIIFIGNVNPTEERKGLTPGKTYYWRIKAVNDEHEGAWSETWSFTIRPELTVPVLVSPIGKYDQGKYVKLVWNKVGIADRYRAKYGTSPSLAGATEQLSTDTVLQIGPLNINTQYYWAVRSENAFGESAYSLIVFFKTGADGVGLEEPEYAVRVYPNPAREYLHMDAQGTRILSWKVLSVDGKKLLESPYTEGVPVPLHSLQAGIYLLEIETEQGVLRHRWIKD